MATIDDNFQNITSVEKVQEGTECIPGDEPMESEKNPFKETFKEKSGKRDNKDIEKIIDTINKFLDKNSSGLGMKITVQPLTEEDIKEVIKDDEDELNIFEHLAKIERQNEEMIAQNKVIKHMLRDIDGSMNTCKCTDGDTESSTDEVGESDAPDLMTRLFNIENMLKELRETLSVAETQNTHILRGVKRIVYPEAVTLEARYSTPMKVELTKKQFNQLVSEMKRQRKKAMRQVESQLIPRVKNLLYNSIMSGLYTDQVRRVIPDAVKNTLNHLKIKYK